MSLTPQAWTLMTRAVQELGASVSPGRHTELIDALRELLARADPDRAMLDEPVPPAITDAGAAALDYLWDQADTTRRLVYRFGRPTLE